MLLCSYPLPPLSSAEAGSGRESYLRAAHLGFSAYGRDNVCARHFPTCQYDSEQLIDFVLDDDEIEANDVEYSRPVVEKLQATYHPNAPARQTVQQRPVSAAPSAPQRVQAVKPVPVNDQKPEKQSQVKPKPLQQQSVAKPAPFPLRNLNPRW